MGLVLNAFDSHCNKVTLRKTLARDYSQGFAATYRFLIRFETLRRCCMSIRSWVRASLLLLGIGLLVGVHAQSSTTGNITGTVRDPQGAAVPKAEVIITEEKTGVSRTIRATEDGFYT